MLNITRERVTWLRMWKAAGRERITHPTFYKVVEPDGYVRYFETRHEALTFVENYA